MLCRPGKFSRCSRRRTDEHDPSSSFMRHDLGFLAGLVQRTMKRERFADERIIGVLKEE